VHFCLINTLTSYHTCHKARKSKASRAENTRTMLLWPDCAGPKADA